MGLSAAPVNAGMVQLSFREIDEDEPLTTLTFDGVTLWRDGAGRVVLVDVPPGFTLEVVK